MFPESVNGCLTSHAMLTNRQKLSMEFIDLTEVFLDRTIPWFLQDWCFLIHIEHNQWCLNFFSWFRLPWSQTRRPSHPQNGRVGILFVTVGQWAVHTVIYYNFYVYQFYETKYLDTRKHSSRMSTALCADRICFNSHHQMSLQRRGSSNGHVWTGLH